MATSLSVKARKELLKVGRKETKIPFKFRIYFLVSYGYSVAKISSRTIREQSCVPNKALKCTSRFCWLISVKSVILVVGDKSSWYFLSGMLAETAATGGIVSQRTAKWTRCFRHLQKERRRFFESQWSLLNDASKSVFQICVDFISTRGFWELLHFGIYFVSFLFLFFLASIQT